MLNEASRNLHSAVSEALKGSAPLTRQAIEDAEIPDAVRSCILARLAREGERVAEAIKARRDPWVSENAEVSRARTALSVAVSRSIQLPKSERDRVIREAVNTVTRYLVRPARTLVEVIFDSESGEIDVDEAMDRMAGLDAYAYFDDVLRHYFQEKQVEQVDRARLDSVLHRVDRQMTSDFSTDEWMEISAPLFETLAYAPEYTDGVPVDLLRTYFREKEAGRILERMEDMSAEEIVSPQRLRRILEKPIAPPAVRIEAPATAPSPSTPAAPAQRASEPQRREQPPDRSDAPLPLWKQFQARPHSEAQTPAAAPREEPTGEPGAPLWQRFRSTSSDPVRTRSQERGEPRGAPEPVRRPSERDHFEPARDPGEIQKSARMPSGESQPTSRRTPAPIEQSSSINDLEFDVLGGRGSKHRKLFVRQIFGGDADAYRDALETIARSRSWTDASRFIAREVFMRHDVNIYDDAAVTFTDLVEERFAEQHRS